MVRWVAERLAKGSRLIGRPLWRATTAGVGANRPESSLCGQSGAIIEHERTPYGSFAAWLSVHRTTAEQVRGADGCGLASNGERKTRCRYSAVGRPPLSLDLACPGGASLAPPLDQCLAPKLDGAFSDGDSFL